MLYLGIDQHRKHLTICVRNEAGDPILRRQVSTRPEECARFFQELPTSLAERQTQGEVHAYMAIVEVCGFNDWLLDKLPEWGCAQVILVQPTERATNKTDRHDAAHLSEVLWINRARLAAGVRIHGLRQVRIPSAAERTWRRLTVLRLRGVNERTKTLNRVRHLLRRQNREYACPTKGIQTVRAKKWLQTLALEATERLELDHLLARWTLLDKQLAELEAELVRGLAGQPAAQWLATIPGCGAATAVGLAARVGPVERFSTPRSLVNYWGLAPTSNNSGDVRQRLGSISKRGSAPARYWLGQLVVHVLRKDPAQRTFFQRIKRRRGGKIALVAVMRRLTVIIWHLLTHQQPYRIGGIKEGEKQTRRRAVSPAATTSG
jgi:transposase